MRLMIAVSVLSLAWLGSAGAAEPIATTDGETPGVKLEVQELKAGNGVVMLKFTVVNDSDKPLNGNVLADPNTGEIRDVGGIYLADTANRKKYLVVRDSASHCLCSRSVEDIAPKSSINLWARFPAPPEGVQKISIVVPHFIPMDDVPLSR